MSQLPEQVVDEAIVWFARLRADDVTASDRSRFFSWLRLGVQQQEAFVEILKLWEGMAVVANMDFEELRPFPPLFAIKCKLEAVSP